MGNSRTRACWPLLVGLVGGCAAPAPTTRGPEHREPRRPPEGTSARACPATWQAAHETPCRPDARLGFRCDYAGARCACEPGPWCVGPAPPPDRPHHLVCRSLDARRPLLDGDGCPLGPVVPGALCDHEGQVCRHRGCSYAELRSTCRSGRWVSEQTIVGPIPQ